MGLIAKSDLKGTYSWTTLPGDDPKVSGAPDSTLLNRQEGYEVLYFINAVSEIRGLTQKSDGLKIEQMLKVVPSILRSQEHIKGWVEANWSKY